MFATENTELISFVGVASAANSSRSDGLFAAKAAPTLNAVQIKATKQVLASVFSVFSVAKIFYRINPPSLLKTLLC